MRSMFVLMAEAAQSFVSFYTNEGTLELEMRDIFTRYGNDVIASIAFGLKVDSLRDKNNQFYLMGKEATDMTSLVTTLKFFCYGLFPKLFTVSNSIIEPIFWQHPSCSLDLVLGDFFLFPYKQIRR